MVEFVRTLAYMYSNYCLSHVAILFYACMGLTLCVQKHHKKRHARPLGMRRGFTCSSFIVLELLLGKSFEGY